MSSIMKFINRTSRCFTLYRNNKLEDRGINGYQHLYIIKICKNPGISQEELVKEIYVNKSSVARQLSMLEQNGFIIRTPHEQDRRQLLVYPTEKAFKIYPDAVKIRKDWNEKLLEDFSETEKEFLLSMLDRIMHKAEYILLSSNDCETKTSK